MIGDESAVDTNTNIRSNELVSGWRRSDLLRNIASSLTSSRSYKDIASTLFRNRNLSDSQRRRLAEEYVSNKYAGKTISDSKRKAEIQSVLNATNYTSNKRVTNTGSVFNPSSMTDWSSLIDDEKLEELKGTDDTEEKTENKKDTDNKKTSGLNTKAPSLEEAKGSTSSKKKKTGLGGFGELKNRIRNRFKKKGKRSKLGGYGDVAGAQMAAVKWFLTLYGHIIYSNDVNLRYNIDVALNGGVGNADCSSSTRWCYLKTLGVDI